MVSPGSNSCSAKTVNLKECVAAVTLIIEKSNSSNGWLQLDLRINSITLKKGMTASACLKETQSLENTCLLQMTSWNNDGTTQMYGSKCSFEITIHLNVGISPLKKSCVIYLIESPLKMIKNAYFILKSLIVLLIFKFLSRFFGHSGKTDLLER